MTSFISSERAHCIIMQMPTLRSFATPTFDELLSVLEQESNILIEWFHFNCMIIMKANPEKFQAIAVGKRRYDKAPIFNLEGNIQIGCEETVKLLCIEIRL